MKIMIFGTANKRISELIQMLRKCSLKHIIYGVDDKFVQGKTNILIKPYEEDTMKLMLQKHKLDVIILAFPKNENDFDDFKYNATTARLLLKYMPKKCKLIYFSTTDLYEVIPNTIITEETALNPHNNYEITKLQTENVVKTYSNSCILRLTPDIQMKTINDVIQLIIQHNICGIYNIAYDTNLIDCSKFRDVMKK